MRFLGGGGVRVAPPRRGVEKKKITELVRREARKTKRKIKESKITAESKQLMEEAKKNIKWFLTDHGPAHTDRVKEYTKEISEFLDEASTSVQKLGRKLSDEEKYFLRLAASLHDVGRGLDGEQRHAEISAKIVNENDQLPFTDEERKIISKLCQLHSKTNTKEIYGTENLKELVEKGIIDQRTAYLSSILRLSDALDTTKERVQTNSQGEDRQTVLNRIKKLPQNERERHLRVWQGHEGIEEWRIEERDGSPSIRLILKADLLEKQGHDISFRVKDVLRDLNSTSIDHGVGVTFESGNKERLKEWFDKHQYEMADELEGKELHLE